MERMYEVLHWRADVLVRETGLTLSEAFGRWLRLMRTPGVRDPKFRRGLEEKRLKVAYQGDALIAMEEVP